MFHRYGRYGRYGGGDGLFILLIPVTIIVLLCVFGGSSVTNYFLGIVMRLVSAVLPYIIAFWVFKLILQAFLPK